MALDMDRLLGLVKQNLVIDTRHTADDELLASMIASAVDYATGYQHLPPGHYDTHPLSASTERAVVMLASHMFEARDGATGGFFADNTHAANQVWVAVNRLLVMDRAWTI